MISRRRGETSWGDLGVPEGMVSEHEPEHARGIVLQDPPRDLQERTIAACLDQLDGPRSGSGSAEEPGRPFRRGAFLGAVAGAAAVLVAGLAVARPLVVPSLGEGRRDVTVVAAAMGDTFYVKVPVKGGRDLLESTRPEQLAAALAKLKRGSKVVAIVPTGDARSLSTVREAASHAHLTLDAKPVEDDVYRRIVASYETVAE